MTITQLFNVSNLFVLPFWALIILLPNWNLTKKVMESYLPFVILALLYIYFFVGAVTPESAQALSSPQLSDLAKAFSDEAVMATGWTHFLAIDLFVGRWIYWEGQRTGVWTLHSLILCLFAGPVGLLSHLVTAWIVGRFSGASQTEISTTATTKT